MQELSGWTGILVGCALWALFFAAWYTVLWFENRKDRRR